jgi:hypothetical protein
LQTGWTAVDPSDQAARERISHELNRAKQVAFVDVAVVDANSAIVVCPPFEPELYRVDVAAIRIGHRCS